MKPLSFYSNRYILFSQVFLLYFELFCFYYILNFFYYYYRELFIPLTCYFELKIL